MEMEKQQQPQNVAFIAWRIQHVGAPEMILTDEWAGESLNAWAKDIVRATFAEVRRRATRDASGHEDKTEHAIRSIEKDWGLLK